MKIALFHNLTSGGAKRASYEVIRRLAKNHSVTVYTLSSANLEFCDLRGAVDGHQIYAFKPLSHFESPLGRLNQLQRWRDLKELLRLGRQIASQVNSEDYDLAYLHPCQFTQAPTLLRYLEIPTVYHVHEPLRRAYEPSRPRPYMNSGLRKTLDRVDPLLAIYQQELIQVDREMTGAADLLLANSQFTADTVSRIYGRSSKVSYFGVDTETFRPLPDSTGEGNYVLSVGALTPYKGFDFLVEAVAKIPSKSRPNLRIVCNAVDERELAYLRNLAVSRGVDLYIEGPIGETELLKRYNEAAVLAYAPFREPFGLVPIESMSCGTPVIGVDEGGVRETVFDGENGLLVPRESTAFAKAIESLLCDRKLRRRLGQQARECALLQWSWEKSVERIEDQLRSVLPVSNGRTPVWQNVPLRQQV